MIKHLRLVSIGCAVVAAALMSALEVRARPMGTAVTYQGVLKLSGSPVNATADFTFTLFDAVSRGTQIGSPLPANAVTLTNGTFTVALDFGPDAFGSNARYLQIAVRSPAGSGGFTTLSPRQALTSAPNALNANLLDGLDSTAFLQAVPVPLWVSATFGAVPIIGVENNSSSDESSAIFGFAQGASGITYGGEFRNNSVNGRAVFAWARASTGNAQGVYGRSDSNSGQGVFGTATNASGITYGGRFESASPSGRGVLGYATSTTGNTYGVYGISNGDNGAGIVGQATNTSAVATTYGVYGSTVSTVGQAVVGHSTATTGLGNGVVGWCDSASGFDFNAIGAGVNYGSTSSRRWKRNVVPIEQPLDKIGLLRGVYFDWDAKHGGQHDVGMIAEEVGAVLPEIVAYEANGVDASGMDYSKLTPLLVEAVNALRAEKDAQIAALEQDNQRLQDRLAALEAAVASMTDGRQKH